MKKKGFWKKEECMPGSNHRYVAILLKIGAYYGFFRITSFDNFCSNSSMVNRKILFLSLLQPETIQ